MMAFSRTFSSMKTKKRQSVYAVLWQDAAFTFLKTLPKKFPPLQLSFGTIIAQTKTSVTVGMNCHFDAARRTITSVKDGFLIPRKAIVAMKRIGVIGHGL